MYKSTKSRKFVILDGCYIRLRNIHAYCILYIYILYWASVLEIVQNTVLNISMFIFIYKKNLISNILISLMFHYVYTFLKSQIFTLFILHYLSHYINPSLFPSFSLHFSLIRSNPKCALLVQAFVVLPTHFSWFRRGTAFNLI